MTLQISAAGLLEAVRRNDITAHNVANVQTPGYQAVSRDSVQFSDSALGALSNEASVVKSVLERSNVDLAEEFANGILDVAAFRANANVFRAQNETLGELLDLNG